MDYYNHPDHWIYAQFPNSVEIERFEIDMVGEKWYVRDAIRHVSPQSCFIYRDLGVFTVMHDVLKLIYFWEIPPYLCGDWKYSDSLSNSQLKYLKEFRDGFVKDIEITDYHPGYGEDEIMAKDEGDNKEQLKDLREAAEQGFADAHYYLGLLYEDGKEVPQNHKKAAEWDRKAAEQGYSAAKKKLEILCRKIPEACE